MVVLVVRLPLVVLVVMAATVWMLSIELTQPLALVVRLPQVLRHNQNNIVCLVCHPGMAASWLLC